MSFKDYASFLNESELNEAKKSTSKIVALESVPDEVIEAAAAAKKSKELETFVTNIPGGESATVMISLFNEMVSNRRYLDEFIKYLWTLKDPNKIDSSMYSTSGSFGQYIFNQKPVGVGRGELFMAWIMKDSKIQGGSVNYDLDVAGQKYEVKDYRVPDREPGDKSGPSPNAPIRLGEKGKVTQFGFWNEIIDTFRRLDKLTGLSQGTPKFNFTETFDDADFVSAVQYLLGRQRTVLPGELNKTDLSNLRTFYEKVANVKLDIDGYTNVILRGPGVNPIEMSIKPITSSQASQKNIQLEPSETVDQLTYILTELRRIKYSRDPKSLDKDLQDVVDKIVGDIPFIVFRKTGINVTNDFVFDSISQGGVKIVERSIAENRK